MVIVLLDVVLVLFAFTTIVPLYLCRLSGTICSYLEKLDVDACLFDVIWIYRSKETKEWKQFVQFKRKYFLFP